MTVSATTVATARGAATRQRVIRAARECVLERGALSVSSNEIARRAGVTWGVIQHHFGTREGILVAVVEDGFSSLRRSLQTVRVDGSADLEIRLRVVVDAVWAHHSHPEHVLHMDILDALRSNQPAFEPLQDMLQRVDDELADLWSTLLEPALPADVPARLVQHLIFATTRGLAATRGLRTGDPAFSEERDLLVRSLASLLGARRARRATR